MIKIFFIFLALIFIWACNTKKEKLALDYSDIKDLIGREGLLGSF